MLRGVPTKAFPLFWSTFQSFFRNLAFSTFFALNCGDCFAFIVRNTQKS